LGQTKRQYNELVANAFSIYLKLSAESGAKAVTSWQLRTKLAMHPCENKVHVCE
jgi:hypothetical protein